MITCISQPLSWYVSKLERGEPFSSALYGDGEWLVACRKRTGRAMAHGEIVTRRMEDEILASLKLTGPRIIRGTDPNLINYTEYAGQDKAAIAEVGRGIEAVAGGLGFVDGVIWDRAVRDGCLAPFLRALKGRDVALVGNRFLMPSPIGKLITAGFVEIPERNAYAQLDRVEEVLLKNRMGEAPVVLLCMGIGAIPLITRLYDKLPTATVIDLGSVLDLFAGIGAERGWRREMYANRQWLEATLAANLEGI